ncbi:hypothetical protein GSI_08979 [Ganoderma sinense ZZ0214-1]|uniref:Osmotin, thaumatin-like protein n=1 Tax=Ganoderma sinense ZZ0214-1 TaxID=1077348 RepID=A0A2G8S584_9APHY|nr:hypothetical protein GSI_08979 [Ganoderma sinense ZZ0214-1]
MSLYSLFISIPFILSALVLLSSARTFTVVNSCPFTIWPAIFTDLSAGTAVPDFPTGWEAPPSNSVSFTVPDNWKAGRIWGRRDCDFTITSGPTCLDGWCNGGLLCDPHTGTGVPPVSVAEWTLQGDGNQDFYDVSLVDGFNLPMEITFTAGINCPTAGCPVDLIPNCPDPLKGPFDSNGIAVGCKSACDANLDGNPTDSANCCTGSHNTPATCPASGVQYYSYFKGNCPDAYAYAYDESSGTALLICNAGIGADYTLTFCPPSGTSSNAASGSAAVGSGTTIATGASTGAAASSVTPASGSSASGSVTSVAGTSSTVSSAQGVSVSDPARPNGAVTQERKVMILLAVLSFVVAVTLVVDL